MEIIITENTARLALLEDIIEKGLGSFIEVGKALMEIRDNQLYEKVRGISNFKTYCKERWGMGKSRAYQLINAAAAVENVSTVVDIIPQTESQTRPLTSLPPEQQREVWREAVKTAPGGRVTADHVYKITKTPSSLVEQEPVSDSFRSAFDTMVEEIKEACLTGWKETSQETAIRLMENLLIIAQGGEKCTS